MTSRALSLASLVLGLVVPVAGQSVPTAAAVPLDLLSPIVGVKDPFPDGVRRSQPVRVSIELLRQARPGHRIRIQMFEDTVFVARLDELEVEPFVKDTLHWRGEIVGRPGSTFVLTVHEDAFAGWIFPNDPKFQSLCIQGAPGLYVARELDDDQHQGTVVDLNSSIVTPQVACNDSKAYIDMLYLYGNGARAAAGSDSKARSAILNAHAQANTCLSRSSISSRLRAKSVSHVNYKTSGNQSVDLNRLIATNDGHMDVAHSRRFGWNADLVAFIRAGSGGVAPCARGWTGGFSVTGYSSLGAMTLAHEIGHNLGGEHDPANHKTGNKCDWTTYGRGHNWWLEDSWPYRRYAFTVLSYESNWGSCGFPWTCQKWRQPNFSSPSISLRYNNKLYPTGTSSRDNRRAILRYLQDVANYSIFVQGRNRPPRVLTHPQDKTLKLGYLAPGTTIMTCSASGRGNTVRYQWRKDGRNLAGKTSTRLTLSTNITSADAGYYDCRITSCAGSVTTNKARLKVGPSRGLRISHPYSQYVQNLGDVDGDRVDDFAIGRNDVTATRSEVYVFSGRTHRRMSYTWFTDGRRAGQTLAGGDLDGDRYRDLIVGAPTYQTNRGAIMVHSGLNIQLGGRSVKTIKVGAVGEYLGGSNLAVGRFDGAANDDLVVGGRNTLYAFSSRSGYPQLWKASIPGRGYFATIGDVNRDGYDDVAVGIPSRRVVEFRSGRNGGLIRTVGFSSSRPDAGFAVTGPGDLNGDRVPDVVVSSPGTNSNRGWVYAISGATGTRLSERFGTIVNNRLGWILNSSGDFNGDGVNDVLASELPVSRSARGYVRVLNGRNLAQLLATYSGSSRYGWDTALVDTDADSYSELLVSNYSVGVFLNDSGPKSSPPLFQIYGRAGPGTGGAIPRISGGLPLARIGGRQIVRLHGGRANSAAICRIGFGRLNVPLDAAGMPGASLLLNPLIDWVVPTNSNGMAQFVLPIPNNTRYTGTRLSWQWYVLDRGGNALGITASDAAEMTVGAR